MKIYLCRHGETTGDVEGRYGGDYDDHLTKKGIGESRKLARKLFEKKIELICHSPKARTVETAKILQEKLKSPLQEIFDLRERNHYGVLTGMTKQEALEKYPLQVKELQENPIHHKVMASEDYGLFKVRVLSAFENIAGGENKSIAIITHGGPIRCIVRELLKKEISSIGDCAVFELEKNKSGYKIINIDGALL